MSASVQPDPPPVLRPLSGEYSDPERERAFRARRLPETLRHLRLLFLLSAILNGIFLLSDWRFHGTPHFWIAVPARLSVVGFSLVCLALVRRVNDPAGAQRLAIVWMTQTAAGVALLVSSRSEIALFVVMLLPMIFYLAVPGSFRWTLAGGIGCSAAMLAGYLMPRWPPDPTAPGMVLIVLILNSGLILTVASTNRLRRMEWLAAREAEAARAEAARSRDTLEAIFMAVPVPLTVSRIDGAIVQTNEQARRFFGQPAGGPPLADLRTIHVDPQVHSDWIARTLQDGQVDRVDAQIRLADGRRADILISARLARIDGEDRIISSSLDITERRAAARRMERLAATDALTGIANRATFLARAAARIAIAEKAAEKAAGDDDAPGLAVLILDVDDFKRINDTGGHDAGDAVLRAIAGRLRGAAGPDDLVARLGGDEFALLIGGVGTTDALDAQLRRVSAALTGPIALGGRVVDPRVSIGASLHPAHGTKIDALMKCADMALYAAKADGNGRARAFAPALLDRWQAEERMLTTARAAVADRAIRPWYQPQVDLQHGGIVGFEALLRGTLPDGAPMTPDMVAAAFDQPDLAQAITGQMLDGILADMRRWLDEGLRFGRVALNLSAADLGDPDFARRYLGRLHAAGIAPPMIELEITETVLLGRAAGGVGDTLRALSAAGAHIALDDFGTGYASLSHLKLFPIDCIKIDRGFVRDMALDPDDAAIVRALLGLAQSLNLETVAEGIERQDQADYLRAGGCRVGQGFLYGGAVPAADVPDLLRRRVPALRAV